MGMPSITIEFLEKAATAIKRGSRGVVGLILKGAVPSTNPVVIETENDIVSTWSNANKQYIKDALVGYMSKPSRIFAFFVPTDAEDYSSALNYFSTQYVDYLAVPTVETDELTSSVVSWVKNEWDNNNFITAVLPNCVGDFEGIINFTTADIAVGASTYTAEQYTPRIAGLLAGTPMNMSATYAVLAEVDDVERLTPVERDAAVDAGKFIIYNDGQKVKVGRAVTSFTTTSATKNNSFKKAHIVDLMRLMSRDIRSTIEDNYIGKYPNSYDNKVLLICAIRAYLDEMVRQELIANGYTLEVDVEANATYLKSKGIDVSVMTEDEIRKAPTDDHVFLTGTMKILDVMEDVDLPINI